MKICTKGIWNETVPGISFNENGVSNFCELQESLMAQYPKGKTGKQDWENLVLKMKKEVGKSGYHCVLGVSGGVDSSYLMILLKEAGLNPLAVNLDNGFNSKIAVQNIYKITKKLKIDLETYVIDYEEIKDLLRSFLRARYPWVDAPTDLAIKAVMYKYAIKENIKFIIRGNDFRSEGKQPKEWTYVDNKQLRYIHNKFGSKKKLKSYPFLPFWKMIFAASVKKIKDVRPFYYLDYQKQMAKKNLVENYDWVDYGGHHHENLFTKFVMAYWLPKKFNIDKRLINLSAQVMSGAITRKDALIQINQPFANPEELEELKTYVLKKLDITKEEFQNIWKSQNMFNYNYPSNYKLIFGLLNLAKPVVKLVFDFKPTSITAKTVIDKK